MDHRAETLFAIYKNGNHLGNERAYNIEEAINKYLIAAGFETLLNDVEFRNQYAAFTAVLSEHYV
ncbi:hypothetical protein [Pedobacter frigidisoli]|uniref:hypothetical protein n=1 Tax=Pedobacter frigidisoli TaxID=2530455 RepID=UPI00292FAADE|nr:hypothetical protein [Pedobacter frigidisoli]